MRKALTTLCFAVAVTLICCTAFDPDNIYLSVGALVAALTGTILGARG